MGPYISALAETGTSFPQAGPAWLRSGAGAEGCWRRSRAPGAGGGRSPAGGEGQRGRAGGAVPGAEPVRVPAGGRSSRPRESGEGAEELSQRRGAAAEGRGPGGAPAPAVPGRGGERRQRRRAGRCPPWPLLISPV